jgi:hypothetical protein
MKSYLSVFALCLLSLAVSASTVPSPKVDERVELLSIVFRLAGSPEYQNEQDGAAVFVAARVDQFLKKSSNL